MRRIEGLTGEAARLYLEGQAKVARNLARDFKIQPQDVPGRDFDHAGMITPEWLGRIVPHTDADFYFCGPKPFMRLLARTLTDLGVDRDRLHYEFFGPADELYA